MQSRATNVADYIASLPEPRRSAIETVRTVILDNLDAGYEEGMSYGMIGYYVPHRLYPKGYHADPKQGLPFAALASQKNHMSRVDSPHPPVALYRALRASDREALTAFVSHGHMNACALDAYVSMADTQCVDCRRRRVEARHEYGPVRV